MSRWVGPLAAVALVGSFVAASAPGHRRTRLVAVAIAALAVAGLLVVGPWVMVVAVLVLLAGVVAAVACLDRVERQLQQSRRRPVCESCRLRPATEKVALAAGVFTVCPACAVPVSRGWAA